MIARLAIALLIAAMPVAASAQQAGVPEPIVRTTIDPPRVMVGQAARLHVDVLAPNYMTSPPVLPDFQLRNAVTRQLQSVNTSEPQNGVAYAGVRYEFAIYPLEAGSYALSDQKVTIKYAAEPPATREAVVALPGLEFEAFIPDAAAGLQPFLSASKLTAEQTIQRSSQQLKAGDSVTRSVIIKAEGTPAMLLPPTAFAATDGLAVYPAQPSLQDKTDGRTDVLSATRVDSATYMLERPGNYALPAIEVRWWNPAKNRIETAHLDAVSLQVAPNPAAQGAAASGEDRARRTFNRLFDLVAGHWLLALIVAAVAALVAWFTPPLLRTIAHRHRLRHEAWLRSESCFFDRLRVAARRGDARAAYFALLDWVQRFEPAAPQHTLESLKSAARDPALDHEIDALQRALFAPRRETADWSSRQLLRRVGAARRSLQPHARRSESTALPRSMNPAGTTDPAAYWNRRPAR